MTLCGKVQVEQTFENSNGMNYYLWSVISSPFERKKPDNR